MLGDPFLDSVLGALVGGLIPMALLWRFRRRILRSSALLFFEEFPKEAGAQWIERALGAYIDKKEVEIKGPDGKPALAVQFVLTERSKAMFDAIAPQLLAALMLQLKKIKIDPAQLAATAQGAGLDLGSIVGGMFGGGGKKKGGEGGLEDMLGGLLQSFLQGGTQGGNKPKDASPGASSGAGPRPLG